MAERILQSRKALALSQVEFAELIGVTTRTVQNWESGGEPRPSHLRTLAEKTGRPVGYFLGMAEEKVA